MIVRALLLMLIAAPAHADLKRVDWANHTYDFTRFVYRGGDAIRLQNGRGKGENDGYGRFTLSLVRVHHGDLTGDLRPDAVVELRMRAPKAADHTNRFLVVFEAVDGKPVQRGAIVFHHSGYEDRIDTMRFSIGPGRLEIASPVRHAPGVHLKTIDHWHWVKREVMPRLLVWNSNAHAFTVSLTPARRVRASKAAIEALRTQAHKAMASFKGQHMDRASQLWMQIIERDPTDAAAWSGLARSLVARKIICWEVMTEARRLNPDDLPLLHAFVLLARWGGYAEGLAEAEARIKRLEAAKAR